MKTFKNPLVVGYKGEIGSFILQGLLRTMPKALNIWCYDINENLKEREERIQKADVIFLCVPMEDTIKWFVDNTSLLKGKIIIEQCSLKEDIWSYLKIWEEDYDFTLLSMHILFRPSVTPNKEDRRVALISHPLWEEYQTAIENITDSQVERFSSYEKHDKTMAFQQALLHRIVLVLDDTMRGLSGKTFIGGKIRELAKRIRGGDPKLYSLIQDNKYLEDAMKEFADGLRYFDIKKEIHG